MNSNFNTKIIDPQKTNLPENAVIQKVHSETERLPNHEHDKAVKAFYFSDSIASGIGKDLAFVDKIPQLINEIIENKSWECLYVSKGVTTPYYCRYVKGTESENFRAFITAKRPNGLETSVETLERVLKAEPEVLRKFRAIIYKPLNQERDEYGKYKSHPLGSDFLTGEVTDRQQRNIRAANRAAEAIPEVGELLDRGLIAIDIAAKLGREIKDPDNLTAEEREYVDKRDLIGIRIRQYIYTNSIPEDEDKEPAYSRELNSFVKDLLGIKDRSKSIRMDHPKKAAEKLLKFYEGEKLQELIDLLIHGNNQLPEKPEAKDDDCKSSLLHEGAETSTPTKSQNIKEDNRKQTEQKKDIGNENKSASKNNAHEYTTPSESKDTNSSVEGIGVVDTETDNKLYKIRQPDKNKTSGELKQTYHIDNTEASPKKDENTITTSSVTPDLHSLNSQQISPTTESEAEYKSNPNVLSNTSQPMRLTLSELAERLNRSPQTIESMTYKQKDKFTKWTQKLDPAGVAWQKNVNRRRKKGEPLLFIPFTETVLEETSQQENSGVIENGI